MVQKNKISNANTDANTNTKTHIQAQIQTGRNVGNSLVKPGRGVALTADGAVSQILAHAHHNTGGWSFMVIF